MVLDVSQAVGCCSATRTAEETGQKYWRKAEPTDISLLTYSVFLYSFAYLLCDTLGATYAKTGEKPTSNRVTCSSCQGITSPLF
jgi:hypothetical protein